MRRHEGVNNIRDNHVADKEARELTVEKSLEISLDRRYQRLLTFGDEEIMLLWIHTLKCRHLDRKESGMVGLLISVRTSTQESGKDRVAV